MGFDINRFKSRLPNEIICCICFGVLDQPHEVIECGHMFCRQCIFKWIHDPYYNVPTCPICRKDICIEDIRPASDMIIQYISRLRIKCDFAELGCIMDIRFGEFNRHRATCPLNPMKPINCHRGCGVRLPPAQMLKHKCELDMCQDALVWNDIFDYVRLEMKRRNFERNQPKHNLVVDSCKKVITFFTKWMADPRLQSGAISKGIS